MKIKHMHVAIQMGQEGELISMAANSMLLIEDPDDPKVPYTKQENLSCAGKDVSDVDEVTVKKLVKQIAKIVKDSQVEPTK